MIIFNTSYQIAYASPFGSTGDQCRVNDVRWLDDGLPPRKVYITGTTAEPGAGNYPLPVLQGSGLFYQGAYGGGLTDAYITQFDAQVNFTPVYSTYWGGNDIDMGVCLHIDPSRGPLVGGSTFSTDLTNVELPHPVGSTTTTTIAGNCDAYVLQLNSATKELYWGTLFGGEADEAFLGLDVHNQHLYAVGETSSLTGITNVTSSDFYVQADYQGYQDELCQNLEGLIVRYELGVPGAVLSHGTYYGGYRSDRIWDVACTAMDEVYIVGRSSSDQLLFPLKEFDLNSADDWYDGDLLNNVGDFYGVTVAATGNFEGRHYGWGALNFCADISGGTGTTRTDAIIASFDVSNEVGIDVLDPSAVSIQVLHLGDAIYEVILPIEDRWRVSVFDGRGALVENYAPQAHTRRLTLDLRPLAAGVYGVACFDSNGKANTIKVRRP